MSYVKEGESIAVRTELNDKPKVHGDYDRQMHKDWCTDQTCWCNKVKA